MLDFRQSLKNIAQSINNAIYIRYWLETSCKISMTIRWEDNIRYNKKHSEQYWRNISNERQTLGTLTQVISLFANLSPFARNKCQKRIRQKMEDGYKKSKNAGSCYIIVICYIRKPHYTTVRRLWHREHSKKICWNANMLSVLQKIAAIDSCCPSSDG